MPMSSRWTSLMMPIAVAAVALAGNPLRGEAEEERSGAIAADIDPLVLRRVAWVQVVTTVCREDAPGMSAHLVEAYDAWLERNGKVKDLIARLEAAENARDEDRALSTYRSHYDATVRIFENKRRDDPEDFAYQCDDFTRELAEGAWDLTSIH